jgi:hypothetical protein
MSPILLSRDGFRLLDREGSPHPPAGARRRIA